MADPELYGAIELGGTKIVMAVGRGDGTILTKASIATRSPDLAIAEMKAFFCRPGLNLAGLGVGAFGPIVIDRQSRDFGRLLETNKPGWSGFDLVQALTTAVGLPVRLFTDVGAAAIGEARSGALKGVQLGLYLTVGTGIGGAILSDGEILPALLHPEMGHIALHRQAGDLAPSACQFHDSCAEGLAAGPAIMARFGKSLSDFPGGSAEQALIADYLGQLCAQLVLTLSPHRIVIGGGVGKTPGLHELVMAAMRDRLGGYALPAVSLPGFLQPPLLGQDAGIVGALIAASKSQQLTHS